MCPHFKLSQGVEGHPATIVGIEPAPACLDPECTIEHELNELAYCVIADPPRGDDGKMLLPCDANYRGIRPLRTARWHYN